VLVQRAHHAMKAKVIIGFPELQRWARGESVVIRLKPGTEELTLTASALAQNDLKKAKRPKDAFDEMLGRMGIGH
jgi:hypothetical protein